MMRKLASTTNVVSAVEARTQFGQLLRRVKKNNERFVIDRRGEPQAIIMSLDDTRLLREVAIKVLPSDLYSPSADGQRFLVEVFASNAQPTLEVILNWAGAEAN